MVLCTPPGVLGSDGSCGMVPPRKDNYMGAGMGSMRDGLSKRQQAVLRWLLKGGSNKEIALALGTSPRTVQKHLQRIYQHLGVQTRTEAIVQMYRGSRRTHSRA